MSDTRYAGKYMQFETVSRKDAGVLMSADSIVGDTFSISFKVEEGETVAWLMNRFGAGVGFFNAANSRELNLLKARGWNIHASLAWVGFSEKGNPSSYWGYACIIANDPLYEEECSAFSQQIFKRLGEGLRYRIDLGPQAIDEMLAAKGNWIPKQQENIPNKKEGSVTMKSRMTTSEKMVEEGRKKNIGCYIITIIFWIAVAAGLFFVAKLLFGF